MSETIHLKISGKKIVVQSQAKASGSVTRPGGWLILKLNDGSQRRVLYQEKAGGRFSASIQGKLFLGEWIAPVLDQREASRGGDSELAAQFPGKVRKLLVKVNQEVEEGEPLVLVEAMKMEFAIKAPYSGRIKAIFVKEGQSLSPGDQFVDLEGSS